MNDSSDTEAASCQNRSGRGISAQANDQARAFFLQEPSRAEEAAAQLIDGANLSEKALPRIGRSGNFFEDETARRHELIFEAARAADEVEIYRGECFLVRLHNGKAGSDLPGRAAPCYGQSSSQNFLGTTET